MGRGIPQAVADQLLREPTFQHHERPCLLCSSLLLGYGIYVNGEGEGNDSDAPILEPNLKIDVTGRVNTPVAEEKTKTEGTHLDASGGHI